MLQNLSLKFKMTKDDPGIWIQLENKKPYRKTILGTPRDSRDQSRSAKIVRVIMK